MVHDNNNPANKVRNAIVEIVEIMHMLFTVEELMTIRGLLENGLSEIPKILIKAERVLSPRAPSAPANSAAFREELTICGISSDLVECSPEPGGGL